MRARLRKKLAKKRLAALRLHPDAYSWMAALLDAPSMRPRVQIVKYDVLMGVARRVAQCAQEGK